jgi:hypothetical protein
MSTTPIPEKPAPPPGGGKFRSLMAYLFLARGKPGEIVIISHSHLFYWWPVWFVGFIMAILTYIHGTRLAVVPRDTKARKNQWVEVKPSADKEDDKQRKVAIAGKPTVVEKRDVLILDRGRELPTRLKANGDQEVIQPNIFMTYSKNLGGFFIIVLLLVIFITNVPLRGLWSVFIIVSILLLSIIFAQAGLWETLINRYAGLAIHINLGGYLFTSLVLFIIWVVNFLFFDRQIYMIFTPGQVRVHLEIGGGETVYDTGGMVFQKQRSDLFRHWILGFGSGDLIVRPAGGAQPIDLHNVLSVGRRVKEIEKRLKEREVVQA